MVILAGVLGGCQTEPPATNQTTHDDPSRFADEISAFEEWDRKNTLLRDAVLLINRGFGGSHISDVNHYLEQTVLKYKPRVVVLYAGDNDIANNKTPSRVLADYQAFVRGVRAELPATPIVFLAVKPSIARWSLWDTARAFNDMVKAYSAGERDLHVVDLAPRMLGADGRPRPELFVEDGLHMSAAGYGLWTEAVMTALAPLAAR
jgi:lysophospholipase L1-like esterase